MEQSQNLVRAESWDSGEGNGWAAPFIRFKVHCLSQRPVGLRLLDFIGVFLEK